MFEFTEDRTGIRPKYVGTIKNKYARRAAMIACLPFLLIVVFTYNTVKALFAVVLILWTFIIWMGLKLVCNAIFKKWEYWDEPRKPS